MAETTYAGTKVNGKSVRGTFSDGTTSVQVDYQGENTILLPLEERELEEFVSQDIAEDALVGKPKYGTLTQNIVFSTAAYEQFETWYANSTELTYTVSGLFASDKTYTGIYISIPEPPTIDPERDGYITNSIGIKSKNRPAATA